MFEFCVRSAGRNDAPFPDTFPDPAGRHSLSPAVLFRLSHCVRGRSSVIFGQQIAVVRHEVALQLVKVLNRKRQEELHSAEDIQQRLRSADTNSHARVSAGDGKEEKKHSHIPGLSLAPASSPHSLSHYCGHFRSSSTVFKHNTTHT